MKKDRLFFGGVHPSGRKELSAKDAPPAEIIPKQVIIPMQQHIGAPCAPLVKAGDKVLRGQKIGDGEGLCVPVHASVSGTVIAVEPRPHPSGRTVTAVVIENDFRDTTVSALDSCGNAETMDSDTILGLIREAGIVGMGGAAFPGSVKTLSAIGRVDTLIANACECEPYITADDTLLRTCPEQTLRGMQILSQVLQPKRVILAVEDNKPEAITGVRELLAEYAGIELAVLPTRYPQGAEKQLIWAITGRQVPPGQLPVSTGCAVFNVSTFAAIYQAVELGLPVISRIVTVSGEAVMEPQNFYVPIGTSFFDLIEAAGGLKDDTERVLSGGPMMGIAQTDLSVPVVKATNCVLGLLRDPNGTVENPVCLRCGKCVSVCPMGLMPLYLYRFERAENTRELERFHIMDCIECGCCTFSCPGKLALVERIRSGKQRLKEVMCK